MKLPQPSLILATAILLLLSLLVSCDVGPKPVSDQSQKSAEQGEAPSARATTTSSQPARPASPAGRPTLPLDKVLVDKNGRQLDVTIIAKSQGFIAVRRKTDQSVFSIPIANLDDNNRRFLQGVDDSTPEEVIAAQQVSAPRQATKGKPLRKARWHNDMGGAVSEAEDERLPIYLLFTGSSWCPPCKSLEATIHNTSEFQEFANGNLVLMKVNVPRGATPTKKKKLIEEYSIRSYPTLIILDPPDEIRHRKSGYSRTDVHSYNRRIAETIRR